LLAALLLLVKMVVANHGTEKRQRRLRNYYDVPKDFWLFLHGKRGRLTQTVFSSVALSEDVERQLSVFRIQVEEEGVESSVQLSRDGLFVGGITRWVLNVGITGSNGGVNPDHAGISGPTVLFVNE